MRLHFIANPVSGPGGSRARAERLVERLHRRGHRVELRFTGAPGDARRFAKEAEGDCDSLIVGGGDGTINEVLNGLERPSDVRLVPLASGTANLLARELEIPAEVEALVGVVEGGASRRIDLGLTGDRRFLGVLSAGFDAMVTRRIAETRGRRMGFTRYLPPILHTLRTYREPNLELTIDGEERVRGAWVVLCNLRTYGGFFTLAERARCDSGLLEGIVFSRAARRHFVRYAYRGLRGGIEKLAGVSRHAGRRFHLSGSPEIEAQIDGDYYGPTPLDADVAPGSACIGVPS